MLRIKVVPGAARTRVVGLLGDRLKVAVAAPPEGGRANVAVGALLGELFGVGRRGVEVTAGHRRAAKTVTFTGIDVDGARAVLAAALAAVG